MASPITDWQGAPTAVFTSAFSVPSGHRNATGKVIAKSYGLLKWPVSKVGSQPCLGCEGTVSWGLLGGAGQASGWPRAWGGRAGCVPGDPHGLC